MGLIGQLAAGLGVVNAGTVDLAQPPASIMPPNRQANITDEAWTLDAVYRAVSILVTETVQLSIDAEAYGQPVPRPLIMRQPNRRDDQAFEWFAEENIVSLASRGEAYWLLTRDQLTDEVINIEVLDPLTVIPSRDDRRRLVWHYAGKTYTARDVLHLKLLRRAGQLHGLGPLQACRSSVHGAVELRRWADGWLDDGGVPNGILSTDQDITGAEATAAKRRLAKSLSYREPAVLGKGLAYKPLLLTPEEMQWLDAQRFNVAAIARMFGIPPRKLLISLEGGSETYANAEQDSIDFMRDTVMKYLREIEVAFSRVLPHGYRARWNLDAALRTDTKTRYEAYQIGIKAGFLTIDHVKQQEGLQ